MASNNDEPDYERFEGLADIPCKILGATTFGVGAIGISEHISFPDIVEVGGVAAAATIGWFVTGKLLDFLQGRIDSGNANQEGQPNG